MPVVVLKGLAAVREALVYRSQDTADRPPPAVYEHLGYGPHAEGKRRGHAASLQAEAGSRNFSACRKEPTNLRARHVEKGDVPSIGGGEIG